MKKTTAYLPNLSKTAHFSMPIEGEKWPPFPRLQSRGPIEAGSGKVQSTSAKFNFHGCKVVAPLKRPGQE